MIQRIENPEHCTSLSLPQSTTPDLINTPGVPPGPPDAHQGVNLTVKFPQRKFTVLQALIPTLVTGRIDDESNIREYFLEQFVWYELNSEGFWTFGEFITKGLCEICFETGPCLEAFWNVTSENDADGVNYGY